MLSIFCFIIAFVLLISSLVQYKTKNISLVSGYNKNNTEFFSKESTNKICNTTAWVLALNGLNLCVSAIFMLLDENSSNALFLCMIAYIMVTVMVSLIFNKNHIKNNDLSEKYYKNMYKINIIFYLVCIFIMLLITNRYNNLIAIDINNFGNIDKFYLNKYILISILSFFVSIDSIIISYIISFKIRTESIIREISIILLNICIVSIICILVL